MCWDFVQLKCSPSSVASHSGSAKEAVQAEAQGQVSLALDCYVQAIEALEQYRKQEHSAKVGDVVATKRKRLKQKRLKQNVSCAACAGYYPPKGCLL